MRCGKLLQTQNTFMPRFVSADVVGFTSALYFFMWIQGAVECSLTSAYVDSPEYFSFFQNFKISYLFRSAWVAQSVTRPTLAQVVVS